MEYHEQRQIWDWAARPQGGGQWGAEARPQESMWWAGWLARKEGSQVAPVDLKARPWMTTEGPAALVGGQRSGPNKLGVGKHERH